MKITIALLIFTMSIRAEAVTFSCPIPEPCVIAFIALFAYEIYTECEDNQIADKNISAAKRNLEKNIDMIEPSDYFSGKQMLKHSNDCMSEDQFIDKYKLIGGKTNKYTDSELSEAFHAIKNTK